MNARRNQLLIAMLLALGLSCAAEVFGAEIRGFLGSRPITHIEAALRGDVPHGCEGDAPSGEELAPGAEVIPQVMSADSDCAQPTRRDGPDGVVGDVPASVVAQTRPPSRRGEGALRWIQAKSPMQVQPSDKSSASTAPDGSRLRKWTIESAILVADNRMSHEALRDLLDEVRRRHASLNERRARGDLPAEGGHGFGLPRAPRPMIPALRVHFQAPPTNQAETQKASCSDCWAHG